MISHEHKFIFIHINKTGGTSIEKVFIDDADKSSIENKHKKIKYNSNNFPSQLKSYFKFAFVRNPWDKVVTQYFLRKKFQDKEKSSQNMSFKEFVMNPVGFKFQNQLDWITLNEKLMVDFIGRFENLQPDFDCICDRIGISRVKLPHIFKSDRMPYQQYYTVETREFVADVFARDIYYFGYKF